MGTNLYICVFITVTNRYLKIALPSLRHMWP